MFGHCVPEQDVQAHGHRPFAGLGARDQLHAKVVGFFSPIQGQHALPALRAVANGCLRTRPIADLVIPCFLVRSGAADSRRWCRRHRGPRVTEGFVCARAVHLVFIADAGVTDCTSRVGICLAVALRGSRVGVSCVRRARSKEPTQKD